jgi:hypothetical protein
VGGGGQHERGELAAAEGQHLATHRRPLAGADAAADLVRGEAAPLRVGPREQAQLAGGQPVQAFDIHGEAGSRRPGQDRQGCG